ncbi:MAG: DinB family protein [Rhodothermales bacterium]|nr:DinB family protein [Rhodothermales bacterium]
MLPQLTAVLIRDLDGLRDQVDLYPDDAAVWRDVPGCPNSGGTLALHLVGNLRHYIGARLGGTGYIRDREAEFASRNVPREQILELIAAARSEVSDTLRGLTSSSLQQTYPDEVAGRRIEVGLWLMHLATHLAYHLGQLDYHRRTVTGDATSAGTVSVRSLQVE